MENSIASSDIESNSDSTRVLLSVQEIDTVVKHPNADKLCIVTLKGMGWQVVEVLDAVKSGDKVLYAEIDALLPGLVPTRIQGNNDVDGVSEGGEGGVSERGGRGVSKGGEGGVSGVSGVGGVSNDQSVMNPWLPEAIKKRVSTQKNQTWFRVKTCDIRKEISQGLLIPFNLLVQSFPLCNEWPVGFDVTQLLGVQKFIPFSGEPGNSGEPRKSTFPTHLLPKTDELRLQTKKSLAVDLNGQPFYITEKCDGQSGTYLVDPDTNNFCVCSRNQLREVPTPPLSCSFWDIAVKYSLEQVMRSPEMTNLAVQGEVCGPGIQGNLLSLNGLDFFVFTIYDMKYKVRVPIERVQELCAQFGLKHVKIVEKGNNFQYDLPSLLKLAEGKYQNSKHEREGIVIRSLDGRVSFKVINNKYLLKMEKDLEKLEK